MFEDAFISPDTGLAVGQVFIGESIGCLEKYHLKKTANAIFLCPNSDTLISLLYHIFTYRSKKPLYKSKIR